MMHKRMFKHNPLAFLFHSISITALLGLVGIAVPPAHAQNRATLARFLGEKQLGSAEGALVGVEIREPGTPDRHACGFLLRDVAYSQSGYASMAGFRCSR